MSSARILDWFTWRCLSASASTVVESKTSSIAASTLAHSSWVAQLSLRAHPVPSRHGAMPSSHSMARATIPAVISPGSLPRTYPPLGPRSPLTNPSLLSTTVSCSRYFFDMSWRSATSLTLTFSPGWTAMSTSMRRA